MPPDEDYAAMDPRGKLTSLKDIETISKCPMAIPAPQGVFVYVPKKDITAAEVAEIMPALFAGVMAGLKVIPPEAAGASFESLSKGCQRHFALQSKKNIVGPGGGLII